MVSLGLGCASYNSSRVSFFGASLVLAAGCLGGLRWALSQHLLILDSAFGNSPLLLVAKVAPYSAFTALSAAILFENRKLFDAASGKWQSSNVLVGIEGWASLIQAVMFIFLGGLASLALLLAEVKVLQLTSSLTLGIMGTFKARLKHFLHS